MLSNVLFWVVACLSAVLLVFLGLVVGGALPIDSPSAPDATSEEVAVEPVPAPSTAPAAVPLPTTATAPAPETTAAPPPTVVVLTAVRGDSWFSARVGSEEGRVLDERVLAQGDSVRLEGPRIWLTVGAAGNVEVTVDGKPRQLEPGTVSLVLARAV
jgi:Domain of unknown function (DUF4115)